VTERWILIPGWQDFQHYKDRDPFWIKDYLRQLRDDDYLGLDLAERGLLLDLRKLYAEGRGVLSESGAKQRLLRSDYDKRTFRRRIESLNHAGFIQISSRRPLDTETETEKERTTAGESTKNKAAGFRNLASLTAVSNDPSPDNGYGLEGAVLELVACLPDRDDGTHGVIKNLVRKHGLAEGDVRRAIEAAKGPGVRSPTKVAIAELKKAA